MSLGWRVAAVILAVLVASVCVRLGFWQLDRLAQRRAYNTELAAAMTLPEVRIDSASIAAIAADPQPYLYRRAVAEGVLVPEAETILRGRSMNGRPGVHLVGALRLASGEHLLVNRGWLPSPDAATVDPRPFRTSGPQRLAGYLRAIPPPSAESAPSVVELADTSLTTYRRLDARQIAADLGSSVSPLYLEESPDSRTDGEPPIPIPDPVLDEGSHLGYAIQWFSFAAIALIGMGVMLLRGLRAPSKQGF